MGVLGWGEREWGLLGSPTWLADPKGGKASTLDTCPDDLFYLWWASFWAHWVLRTLGPEVGYLRGHVSLPLPALHPSSLYIIPWISLKLAADFSFSVMLAGAWTQGWSVYTKAVGLLVLELLLEAETSLVTPSVYFMSSAKLFLYPFR